MNNRREATVERFTHIATELKVSLYDAPSASEWFDKAPEDGTNLHRPFGFMPIAPDGTLFYAPDVIVEQGAYLNDEDFKAYLDVLQVHLYMHVEFMDDPDIERTIDREMYDMAAGSQELLSRVQMHVLDRACQ